MSLPTSSKPPIPPRNESPPVPPGDMARRPARLEVETLEPRILMSGTWIDPDTGNPQSGPTGDADIFQGSAGADSAAGGGGHDLLYGHDGNDTLLATAATICSAAAKAMICSAAAVETTR